MSTGIKRNVNYLSKYLVLKEKAIENSEMPNKKFNPLPCLIWGIMHINAATQLLIVNLKHYN